ncbi:phage antirepressor KilAC domain-containing protein [Thalassospira sp. MCCC 1A01428]|uniref:phage antirepressor KilAC domain-containing protein n=1 Tax=Thalassospira sp. MCCC 1A01428 TaxID=1470575 RepID=UPI000A1DA186|nr:phage antirepressor KilAC domain-containing protein [Thalassospira sp. MCCC 1A01428]
MLQNAEQAEHIESQSKLISEMAPKVDGFDLIAHADGSLCITDAAKTLQKRPKDLFAWMGQNGWIYKRTGSATWIGYQSKTSQGLLEHKTTTAYRSDGSEKITEQVRVTPKGLTKLALVFGVSGTELV